MCVAEEIDSATVLTLGHGRVSGRQGGRPGGIAAIGDRATAAGLARRWALALGQRALV
jgi:hypothetical protein